MAGPQRLIFCVDGTWCGPDRAHPQSEDTITNIYQICASIKKGRVEDGFFQEPKYMHGIGSIYDKFSWSKLTAGLFGKSCLSQIQEVYEECCKLGPEDEVWLFGFSRGAFVVRAVAGLLHYMQTLSSAGTPQFKKDYKRSLSILQSMLNVGNLGNGQIHSHFFAATKPPPKIKFVGLLDTIKMVEKDCLFDISFNDSIQHMRHALALNEEREVMTPEYIFPETNDLEAIDPRTLIQAWFVGVHMDMGGSTSPAGLSLYPLQWLLIENQSLGLKLSFAGTFGKRAKIDNPIDLVFPSTDEQGRGAAMWPCKMENGIEVSMQDLRRVHTLDRYKRRYAIKLPKGLPSKKGRVVFDRDGTLNGWIDGLRQGTIIHPSVYFHLDVSHIGLDADQTELRTHLDNWREKTLGLQNNVPNPGFWSDHSPPAHDKIKQKITHAIEDTMPVGFMATVVTLGHPWSLAAAGANIPLVVPATAQLILTLSADLILILAASFTVAAQRNVGQPLDQDLENASRAYLPFSKDVHRRIKDLVPKAVVCACRSTEKIEAEFDKVIEEYRSKVVDRIAAMRTGKFISRSSSNSSGSSLGKEKDL